MGTRPAHVPVLAKTAIDMLGCSSGKVVVDATLGGGGHAGLILEKIGKTGHLIGIDWDQRAIESAKRHLGPQPNLSLIHDNFRNLAAILSRISISRIDALLLDLGLSSLQLEEASRGLSFQREGPLDMRMDTRLKTTAADIVNTYPEKEIVTLLRKYGEEPNARKIAKSIVQRRMSHHFNTTTELANMVRSVAPRRTHRTRIDPATRTFQALRIAVNSELDNLTKVLEDGIVSLNPNGRICVISFHSLEDRIVKSTFVRLTRGCNCPPELPKCVCGGTPLLKILTPKPIRPSQEEIIENPRSRSAKLRTAERICEK